MTTISSSTSRRRKSKNNDLPVDLARPTVSGSTATLPNEAHIAAPLPEGAGSGAEAGRPPGAATASGAATSLPPAPLAPARPSGKLGLLVDRLGIAGGATVEELASATGWQKHTVHGALSRLRTRGFAMQVDREGDRKAYRLDRPHLDAGIGRTEG